MPPGLCVKSHLGVALFTEMGLQLAQNTGQT